MLSYIYVLPFFSAIHHHISGRSIFVLQLSLFASPLKANLM